ncbi:MAG: hypothetical protein ACI4M5_00535 [Christensenellales bacterium]
MKEMQIWVKTALRAYGTLDRVADTLDKLLMSTGLKGFNYLGDVTVLFDKMLEMVKRKERIVNLKVLVEQVFAKMDDKLVDVLRLRYVQDCNYSSIAQGEGVCLKTAFRRCSIALATFEEICLSLGCDKRWFEQYIDDPLVGKIYEKCRKRSLAARAGRSKSWTEEELQKRNSEILQAEQTKAVQQSATATILSREHNFAQQIHSSQKSRGEKPKAKILPVGYGA